MNEEIIEGLKKIRIHLESAKAFPPSLSGACNVSSILIQAFLENKQIPSVIKNNSKHAFNMIGEQVIDLTATQISKTKFDPVSINPYEESVRRANSTLRGRNFYSLNDEFVNLSGSLKDILKVNPDLPNDVFTLNNILLTLGKVLNLDLSNFSNRETNEDNVNQLASYIYNHLTKEKDFFNILSNSSVV